MAGFDAAELGLKKSTKKAPLPGTTEAVTERACPACIHGIIVKVKPCCGSPKGKFTCPRCGYTEIIT